MRLLLLLRSLRFWSSDYIHFSASLSRSILALGFFCLQVWISLFALFVVLLFVPFALFLDSLCPACLMSRPSPFQMVFSGCFCIFAACFIPGQSAAGAWPAGAAGAVRGWNRLQSGVFGQRRWCLDPRQGRQCH